MLLIGDVHGEYNRYKRLIAGEKSSIQVGDMGFDYRPLADVGLEHRFIKGNHDNYAVTDPHELGDFGVHEGIFFIRGAKSIDAKYRTLGLDLFDEEQLSYASFMKAIEAVTQAKPDVIVSHECPHSVCVQFYGYEDHSSTRQGLEAVLYAYQPKLWVFGHHHKSMDVTINGTRFVCLNILESMRI